MLRRLIRVFLLTWFSFAFFYSTMMPFVLDLPTRELIRLALITGVIVALLSSLFEWMRLRHQSDSHVRQRQL
jgi:hypothetical protein